MSDKKTHYPVISIEDEHPSAPNPWVKIEDIPEEWKDGRPVDFFMVNDEIKAFRRIGFRFVDGHWSKGQGIGMARLTFDHMTKSYAMLPPAPPQQKETQ